MPETAPDRPDVSEIRDVWPLLTPEERLESFSLLRREDAEELYLGLSPLSQATILLGRPAGERKIWMRLLAPDDAADVLQEVPPENRAELLGLLGESARREVVALLAYAEDEAGGLMSPRFARARPEMTVEEAIRYVRRQARNRLETIYYVYVLDARQRLLGVVSFRELLTATADRNVEDVMRRDVATVPEDMDQETVARIIARHDILAVPVVDPEGRMKGIVTVDDVVDVVEAEATEDMHKLGGMEALETPYLQTRLASMLKARAGWLAVLFLGELLTASAMGRYEDLIAHAVVLAVFVPLIISSGGNAGSQASTLVIRAMALGQVKLRDWHRIARRELLAGLSLGCILAVVGAIRVVAWEGIFGTYGDGYLRIAATVALSLVGVVLWGTITGAMLPFLLRTLRFDPASASAPFVATLVDVFGLVIYFNAAALFLRGTLV
jgi:magnesium transporter